MDGRKNNGGHSTKGVAGRKPKNDEDKVRNLAIKAIESKYKSVSGGFKALLSSGEPALMKFVFEHAVGKPKDTIKHEGGGLFKILSLDPLSDIDATNDSPSQDSGTA